MPIPTAFPILGADLPPRMTAKFQAAVGALRTGLAASSIRKVELDEAKSTLGRAFEKGWERHVAAPHFHGGRFEDQPEALQTLYHGISAWSLHQASSIAKKIDKSGLDGPVIDAMRSVIAEALPLAEAVNDLKQHVVKGRAPNPAPAPARERKNGTGTCSCCFSGVAITDAGKMAHHGYTRPGYGYQTSSCSGISFPPLEASTEGLEWLIGERERQHEKLRETIAGMPERREIQVQLRTRAGAFETRVSRIGDDNWERVKRAYGEDLERRDRGLTSELDFLRAELVKWSPVQKSENVDAPGPSI